MAFCRVRRRGARAVAGAEKGNAESARALDRLLVSAWAVARGLGDRVRSGPIRAPAVAGAATRHRVAAPRVALTFLFTVLKVVPSLLLERNLRFVGSR